MQWKEASAIGQGLKQLAGSSAPERARRQGLASARDLQSPSILILILILAPHKPLRADCQARNSTTTSADERVNYLPPVSRSAGSNPDEVTRPRHERISSARITDLACHASCACLRACSRSKRLTTPHSLRAAVPTHDHHDGDATKHGAGAATVPSTGPSSPTSARHGPHPSPDGQQRHTDTHQCTTQATQACPNHGTGHTKWPTVRQ